MDYRVATTQWSQVLAARDGTETESRRALEELCQTYWQPLYAFVRRLGSDPDEASDITQAYFAELLEKYSTKLNMIDNALEKISKQKS